jgi:hypothetical protein
MAKKKISSVDLIWLILEKLSDPRSRSPRPSLAVIPDDKHGWRVIVSNSSKRLLKADDMSRLTDVQRQLRLVYELSL